MWKIRLVFSNAGIIHIHSSTEPKEIFNSFGQRVGLNYTPIESSGSDTIGYLNWGREDLFIAWREVGGGKGTKKDGKHPITQPRASNRQMAAAAALQVRILALVGREKASYFSEAEIARQLDEHVSDIHHQISVLLKAKKLGLPRGASQITKNRMVRWKARGNL